MTCAYAYNDGVDNPHDTWAGGMGDGQGGLERWAGGRAGVRDGWLGEGGAAVELH